MAENVDFDSFPVAVKRNKFQDFAEAQELPHHRERTLTELEEIERARVRHDQPEKKEQDS